METPEITPTNTSNADKSNSAEVPLKNSSDKSDMTEDNTDIEVSDICKENSENNANSYSDVSKSENIKSESLDSQATKLAKETNEFPEFARSSESTQDPKDKKVSKETNTAKELSSEIKKGEIKIRGVTTEDEDPLVIDEAGDEDTKSESDRAAGSEVHVDYIHIIYSLTITRNN